MISYYENYITLLGDRLPIILAMFLVRYLWLEESGSAMRHYHFIRHHPRVIWPPEGQMLPTCGSIVILSLIFCFSQNRVYREIISSLKSQNTRLSPFFFVPSDFATFW